MYSETSLMKILSVMAHLPPSTNVSPLALAHTLPSSLPPLANNISGQMALRLVRGCRNLLYLHRTLRLKACTTRHPTLLVTTSSLATLHQPALLPSPVRSTHVKDRGCLLPLVSLLLRTKRKKRTMMTTTETVDMTAQTKTTGISQNLARSSTGARHCPQTTHCCTTSRIDPHLAKAPCGRMRRATILCWRLSARVRTLELPELVEPNPNGFRPSVSSGSQAYRLDIPIKVPEIVCRVKNHRRRL
jgi:hypothetical protein